MTNLDGKVQIDKKTRKHGDMLLVSVRAIVCGPSKCVKDERADEPVGKSARCIIRERVRVVEIAATAEILIWRIS